jgi:hypothetical protein
MMRKLLIAAAVVLFFAHPAFAQFGQSNRLNDLAARLSRDAAAFADATYGNYTNSSRNNSRTEVEAVMLSQQFSASAQIFYRMVIDRRRNQDLRDAFSMLQELARSAERTSLQRNTWYNIQRSMSDLSREFDNDSSSGNQPPADTGRGGRMTWRGRVDDDVRIIIRGGSADVETIGGTPYNDGQPNFSASLPSRRVNIRLVVRKGRGEVFIEQQPSRDNDFTAVIRIKDTRGGASEYEFELTW